MPVRNLLFRQRSLLASRILRRSSLLCCFSARRILSQRKDGRERVFLWKDSRLEVLGKILRTDAPNARVEVGGELLCEPTGQMQVSGCFTCTITGHRMGAGGNEISSCVAGASKVCAPSPFCTAWGIEFRHERARRLPRSRLRGDRESTVASATRGEERKASGWLDGLP